MFAGPNGSGKTTVKTRLQRPPEWFGIYINPDEIEATIRSSGVLQLDAFGVEADTEEVRGYFVSSTFLQSQGLAGTAAGIAVHGGRLHFDRHELNSYHASVLADFLRRKAMKSLKSFSFETVMSSRDKVELLRDARAAGFRTYLYYVATQDPAINIERVKRRVATGGHDVPIDKIISRYHRSLSLVPEAIRHADRAFFFDTSGDATKYIASVEGGSTMTLQADDIPNWFSPIWSQF
jgi:predicted ABC-type ATPase